MVAGARFRLAGSGCELVLDRSYREQRFPIPCAVFRICGGRKHILLRCLESPRVAQLTSQRIGVPIAGIGSHERYAGIQFEEAAK